MIYGRLQKRFLRRWPISLFLAVMIFITGSSLSAQNISGGLGVGRGFGTEVGINLDALNQIQNDINNGMYDRPCTAAEHDRTKWHLVVNPVLKCHYDHHHGDDPTYVNDIFGEPGAWFGSPGQSVSYPWQTFPAANQNQGNEEAMAAGTMENDMKHEGYGWVVRRDQPCPDGNCITDFRLQYHGIFGATDAISRYHSYSIEVRMCVNANDPSTCGIMRNAGWADFGRLFTTEPGVIDCRHSVRDIPISLPMDTLFFSLDRPQARDEARCHPNVTDLSRNPGRQSIVEWWGHSRGDHIRFQLRSYDPLGNINPNNPGEWQLYCEYGDTTCKYNQSIVSVFIGYVLHIHEFISSNTRSDANRDGRTDFRGYVSRWGGHRPNCTSAGLDCIPLEYDNIPLNLDYNNDGRNEEARYFHTVCEQCERVDYDLAPAGKQWLTWFFRYAGIDIDPPPQPEPTEEPTAAPTEEPTIEPTEEPTQEPTPGPIEPSVVISALPQTAAPGDTVDIALDLYNVSELYGLQAECTVNPAVLTGIERVDGLFNAGNSFFVDTGFNTGDGRWTVAASLLSESATGAINGNGTAFTLKYTVQATGENNLSCSVLAVDANGHALDVIVVDGSLDTGNPEEPTETPEPPTETPEPPTETPEPPTETPEPPTETPEPPTETPEPGDLASINGVSEYQNRSSNAGIKVELFNRVDQSLVSEMVTAEDGAYTFAEVPLGTYNLLITAPQHIPVIVSVDVISDMVVTVEARTLSAGDVDDSGAVDIIDATFVGANFGLDVVTEIANMDLNGDGLINITDLVLVGSNFGLTSPLPSAE